MCSVGDDGWDRLKVVDYGHQRASAIRFAASGHHACHCSGSRDWDETGEVGVAAVVVNQQKAG